MMGARSRLWAVAALMILLAGLAPPAQADDLVEQLSSAPSHLQAIYDATTGNVALSWQGPANASHFNVYRHGQLIATVTQQSYTDTAPGVGLIPYTVTSMSADGESAPAADIVYSPGVMQRVPRMFHSSVTGQMVEMEGALVPCTLIILGWSDAPPYVAHMDWDCLGPITP